MPAPTVCSTPGCPNLTPSGRCPTCKQRARRDSDTRRPTAAARGYDAKWRRNRARFLTANPTCDCGNPATVADHDPVSRRDLITAGDPHPDAWRHLKPRCADCHNRRTARDQPGGWNQ